MQIDLSGKQLRGKTEHKIFIFESIFLSTWQRVDIAYKKQSIGHFGLRAFISIHNWEQEVMKLTRLLDQNILWIVYYVECSKILICFHLQQSNEPVQYYLCLHRSEAVTTLQLERTFHHWCFPKFMLGMGNQKEVGWCGLLPIVGGAADWSSQ